jgi:hypothetical protein
MRRGQCVRWLSCQLPAEKAELNGYTSIRNPCLKEWAYPVFNFIVFNFITFRL